MAMVFPAYDTYDHYGYGGAPTLPLSRRQSMAYGGGYPYDHGMYSDPMYSNPEYSSYYGQPSGAGLMNHRLIAPTAYDDLTVREPYYPEMRPMSAMGMPRIRRHSTVSFVPRPPPMDAFRRASTIQIKFRRRGSLLAGVSLAEAQSHVRLSNNESYTLHDLHCDRRNTIYLKVRWAGYNSMTYEIPLESYEGHISLSTLARRVSRACVHYLQANMIPVPWDRVELHHLEEVGHGVWQPMLSAR